MTKVPTPADISKGQSDNTNNATKKFDYTAAVDRLRTVSWKSMATQLVWLTGLRTQPSHSPQQSCNQKDTHLKILNKPPCIDNNISKENRNEASLQRWMAVI